MTTALATMPDAEAIEQVLVNGDLARLTPAQRVAYYNRVCQSLGLNPLTKPFDYISLNGKLVLYAKRDAAEQLRKIHGVSIIDIQTQRFDEIYVVTVKAQDKTGRADASTGAVPLGRLAGEALANAIMKAETKAKRRVTLSICGLGMLDETEVETIAPRTEARPDPPTTVVNTVTGEEVPATERPAPPPGYAYIHDCTLKSNGWYEVRVLNDGGTGVTCYSTKLQQLGAVAMQAFQDGVPVAIQGKKGKQPGDWYLNGIATWKPTLETEVDEPPLPSDDEIPF